MILKATTGYHHSAGSGLSSDEWNGSYSLSLQTVVHWGDADLCECEDQVNTEYDAAALKVRPGLWRFDIQPSWRIECSSWSYSSDPYDTAYDSDSDSYDKFDPTNYPYMKCYFYIENRQSDEASWVWDASMVDEAMFRSMIRTSGYTADNYLRDSFWQYFNFNDDAEWTQVRFRIAVKEADAGTGGTINGKLDDCYIVAQRQHFYEEEITDSL